MSIKTNNVKTPEEIKKGIKCAIKGCMEPEVCEACPYYIKDGDVMCCTSDIISDSLAYIEELEERINLMMIDAADGDCGCCVYGDLTMNELPCSECIQSPSHPMWEYDGLPELSNEEI